MDVKNIHKLIVSLTGVVLLIGAVEIGGLFWAFDQMQATAESREHNYKVINYTGELMSLMKNAETNQRGYLLTGDLGFLEQYLMVRDNIHEHLRELQQITLIHAAKNRLATLAPLIVAKLVYLEETTELYRTRKLSAALEHTRNNQGTKLTNLIRTEMAGFIQIEENVGIQREAKFRTDIRRLFVVIISISLFTLLLAVSFAYFSFREAGHRFDNVIHLETQQLLEIQEETNRQLQKTNAFLQISEAKLSVTLSSIGDAVMVTDAKGLITLLNPVAEQLTGWTLAEAAGHPEEEIFNIIKEETREHALDPIKDTLAKGTTHLMSNHIVLIARNGSECSITDSCAPIRNLNGQVIGAVMVFRDVTERRGLERGMELTRTELTVIKKTADEAREFAESIINTVREPLIALNQDLRVVLVSRSFYDVFKVNPEETVGQLIYDLGNKQWNIPGLRELLETILPKKSSFDNYEVEHDFATIGQRTMLLNARQIQRSSEKERIILLAIEDITERKEIEKGLEKTRKELAVSKITADEASEYAESIINTVREPLISLNQDLRVVSVSRSFYDVFKANPEETVGQLIYDLGNKQWNIPGLRELLETILPQKSSFDNYEVEHDFATIGQRTMLLNARQIQRSSEKERIILLAIEDITARKEIEKGLEKANEELKALTVELKRSTRAKSEFLANMSHELRTPLNSINGFSEVLYDETFGPFNAKQKEYIEYVLSSGKHLLLLINQILDMSKVESGKMKLILSDLSMKNLLKDISMLVTDMVGKKELHMVLEIAEDLPNIEADELKVKEIIYNLLSNAVKFTLNGGEIGIRAKRVGSNIEVEVWDTGIGIADENIEKIFEGFFRVDTPYSRITEGTGLGLPLSKKLVELHGGKLSVESEGLEKGTLVRFNLPIKSRSVA